LARRKIKNLFCSILGLAISMLAIIFYFTLTRFAEPPYVEVANTLGGALAWIFILSGFSLFVVKIILVLSVNNLQPKLTKYFKILIEVLNRWNANQLFKSGVHSTTVKNLNYIQITLLDYIVLIQPHLKPISRYGVFCTNGDYIEPQSNKFFLREWIKDKDDFEILE
jgi:hypothetical protein